MMSRKHFLDKSVMSLLDVLKESFENPGWGDSFYAQEDGPSTLSPGNETHKDRLSLDDLYVEMMKNNVDPSNMTEDQMRRFIEEMNKDGVG